MHYLPLFEGSSAHTSGNVVYQNEPSMLFEQAVYMHAIGDAISLTAQGRQIGIVLLLHPWSGKAIVRVNDQPYHIDLFSAIQKTSVFEIDLPDGIDVTISIEAQGTKQNESQGTEVWIQGIYLSEYRTCEIPQLIQHHVEPEPFSGAALNQLTDVFKWYDANWCRVMETLACVPTYTPPNFVHRKCWEWVQCIYGLDYLGMLRPEHRALGVGVGWEPLSYFLSNYLSEVVATDLYPVDHMWSDRGAKEGDPRILEDPETFAPFAYQKDRLRFIRMDGKQLDFPDNSFDVVWSCSSIEHFGKHSGAAASMREIERVLRPGGVVAMITEYVLPDPSSSEFMLFDAEYFNLRCVYEYLVRSVPKLQLVQQPDFSLPEYYIRRAIKLPEMAQAPHDGSGRPHIVLLSPSGALHTSIALFFRKVGGTESEPPRLFVVGQQR